MKTQAQLESSLRQFMRTRPNEELSRVANSTPDSFRFYDSKWNNGQGCLICHLADADETDKYYSYKNSIEGAEHAEFDYMTIRHHYSSWDEKAESWAGAICIRLANEVLAERGDMNILDEVEATSEFDRERLPTVR